MAAVRDDAGWSTDGNPKLAGSGTDEAKLLFGLITARRIADLG
jgi:hypothetical protein